MHGSNLLKWTGLNTQYTVAFYSCFVVHRQSQCIDLLLITGLVSLCSVLVAEISILGMRSMDVQLILLFNFPVYNIPQQLKCRASLAWEPFLPCLCTQAIAPHTGRASRWVLSNSCWFHGTLVCLLHQLRAHQLCTTGFGVAGLSEKGFSAYLIWIFLPPAPQTASPVQGRLQQRPAAGWNTGPWCCWKATLAS